MDYWNKSWLQRNLKLRKSINLCDMLTWTFPEIIFMVIDGILHHFLLFVFFEPHIVQIEIICLVLLKINYHFSLHYSALRTISMPFSTGQTTPKCNCCTPRNLLRTPKEPWLLFTKWFNQIYIGLIPNAGNVIMGSLTQFLFAVQLSSLNAMHHSVFIG